VSAAKVVQAFEDANLLPAPLAQFLALVAAGFESRHEVAGGAAAFREAAMAKGGGSVIVRIVVRPKERASVRHLVHATRHEPVAIDAERGIVAFDVVYRRVEAILNRLARSGVCEFSAHIVPTG